MERICDVVKKTTMLIGSSFGLFYLFGTKQDRTFFCYQIFAIGKKT
jgi:hypothetical protein